MIHVMSDYPDHLNPFKKTGLRASFRSIKSVIGGHFRKKDNHHYTSSSSSIAGVRLRTNGSTNNGVQVPRSETIIGATGTPEMLPRSRFNERVVRAHTMDFRAGGDRCNPFDDDARRKLARDIDAQRATANGQMDAGSGIDTTRRRHRKKRAPLPPGSRSMLTVPGEHSTSQWSIDSCTSYDTDYSTTAHAHSENEDASPENAERLKDIQEISKEIQNLCNEEVNSVSLENSNGDCESENTPQDVEEVLNDIPETSSSSKDLPDSIIDNSKKESQEKSLEETIHGGDVLDEQAELIEALPIQEINNNNEGDTFKLTPGDEIVAINKDNNVAEVISEAEEHVEEIPLAEEEKQTGCDTCDSNEVTSNNSQFNDADMDRNSEYVTYVDEKSLFLTGSTEALDVHKSETKLYVTGSCDQLVAPTTPTPKIRKHKLGREILLGSTDDCLNSVSEKS